MFLRKTANFAIHSIQMTGFYYREGNCLLCGTNWVPIYKELHFIFK